MATKILFYQNSASAGGSKQSLLAIIELLSQDSRFAVKVICSRRGWFSSALEGLGLSYDYVPGAERLSTLNSKGFYQRPFFSFFTFLRSVPGIFRVWRAICRAQVDYLVINEGGRELPEFLPFLVLTPKKVLVISQIETELESVLSRFICRRVARILTASQAVKQHFIAHGYSEEKLLLTPLIVKMKENFVTGDTKRGINCGINCDIKAELGLPADAQLIINIASLHPRKGFWELIDSYSLINQNYKNCYLLQVGAVCPHSGQSDYQTKLKYWQELQAKIKRLGLEEKVKFLGWRDDTTNWLRSCSLMLHPSHREGLSRVSVEALWAGLPIVAYDLPSMREVVKHNQNGYLVPIGDIKGLAIASLNILKDDDQRAQLAVSSRHIWEQCFTSQQTSATTLESFASLP